MPYNYLLQPGICKGTTVLKFGLSYKDDRSRILSYGKKTFVYYEIDTINPKLVEDYLKKEFNKKFELHDGQEYFKGDVVAMCETFLNICEKYKNMKYDSSIEVVFPSLVTRATWKRIINCEPFKCHKEKMKLTFHKINTMVDYPADHNIYKNGIFNKYYNTKIFERRNIYSNTKCYPYTTFEEWRDVEREWIKAIYIINKKKLTGCIVSHTNCLFPFNEDETLEGWVWTSSDEGRRKLLMIDNNCYTYDYMNERETNRLVINDIIEKAHKAYTKLPSNKRDIIKKHSKRGISIMDGTVEI